MLFSGTGNNLGRIRMFFYAIFLFIFVVRHSALETEDPPKVLYTSLTDDNWDPIQSGEWLVGIYHEDWKESSSLVGDWDVFALKCKELGIQAALVNAKGNPGLQVRFLIKSFPKVFHIKDGIVRMFKIVNRDELVRVIKDQKWEELDLVSSLLSPLSWHVSVFSFLCAHSLKLYNIEKIFLAQFFESILVVNAAFCLTFVLIGTVLGLTFSCFFQILKFVTRCCLKSPQDDTLIERPLSPPEERSKSSQTSQSKTVKHLKKQNTGKLRKRRN